MKKITFILAIMTSYVYGQVNIGTESIGINSSISNPYKLFIKGQGANQLFLDNSGENNNTISFGENTILHSYLGFNKPSNSFQFFTNGGYDFYSGGGTALKRFHISSTGKIGIGTTPIQDYFFSVLTPANLPKSTMFSQARNALSYYDFYNTSNGGNAGISTRFLTTTGINNDTTYSEITKYKSGSWLFSNKDPNANINFDVPNIGIASSELYISNNGLIGIGNSAPNARLDIKHSGTSDALQIDNNGDRYTTFGIANNNTRMMEFKLDDDGNSFNINSLKDNQSIKINSKTSASAPLKVNITPTDIFMYGDINLSNAVKIESGDVLMPNGIKFGGTTAGNIRFSGGDFQGYNGSEWISLTQPAKITSIWVPSPQHTGFSYSTNPCANACQYAQNVAGFIAAADSNGNVCRGEDGYRSYVRADLSGYWCGGSASELRQCHCIKVN